MLMRDFDLKNEWEMKNVYCTTGLYTPSTGSGVLSHSNIFKDGSGSGAFIS